MRGTYCTDLQPAQLDNCTPSAIADGLCCPEHAVPCKTDDPNYLCRANPDYGKEVKCGRNFDSARDGASLDALKNLRDRIVNLDLLAIATFNCSATHF